MAVKLRNPLYYGASPITQPSGSTQAAVTSTSTITAVSTSVISACTSDAGSFGFTSAAQGRSLVTNVAEIATRLASHAVLLNALRSALVSTKQIAGA